MGSSVTTRFSNKHYVLIINVRNNKKGTERNYALRRHIHHTRNLSRSWARTMTWNIRRMNWIIRHSLNLIFAVHNSYSVHHTRLSVFPPINVATVIVFRRKSNLRVRPVSQSTHSSQVLARIISIIFPTSGIFPTASSPTLFLSSALAGFPDYHFKRYALWTKSLI